MTEDLLVKLLLGAISVLAGVVTIFWRRDVANGNQRDVDCRARIAALEKRMDDIEDEKDLAIEKRYADLKENHDATLAALNNVADAIRASKPPR